MTQIAAYLRVSTGAKGKSGLGLNAQRSAIARFAESAGAEIVAEHVEIETGKGADALGRRPKLAAALAQAKKTKASVCVAKLCRLSRDVAFISGLMAQRVPFIVAELGDIVGAARGAPGSAAFNREAPARPATERRAQRLGCALAVGDSVAPWPDGSVGNEMGTSALSRAACCARQTRRRPSRRSDRQGWGSTPAFSFSAALARNCCR